VATTFFNWAEITLRSNNDLAAVLCLTYAQTSIYNEISAKTLMSRLAIHHIPLHLFHRKHFIQYKRMLVCSYTTKEPQSYFNNPSFLFLNAPARDKVAYIKALSLRRISSSDNHIPLKYYPNAQPNLFFTITKDKILFPLESSVSRNNTTKN
jgi:hypothetical protein